MKPAKAMQAALEADRNRQMVEVLHHVTRCYGVNAYYSNLANLWWGWRLEWKPQPWRWRT